MVFYCVGDCRIKRAAFLSASKLRGEIYLDNDEVGGLVSDKNGETVVVKSDEPLPFADFTVGEFVAYSRALTSEKPMTDSDVAELARSLSLRVPLRKKMGELTVVQRRSVMLLAKHMKNLRSVFINMDGSDYSPRVKFDLTRLLRSLSDRINLFVSVSDLRFIPTNAHVISFS